MDQVTYYEERLKSLTISYKRELENPNRRDSTLLKLSEKMIDTKRRLTNLGTNYTLCCVEGNVGGVNFKQLYINLSPDEALKKFRVDHGPALVWEVKQIPLLNPII